MKAKVAILILTLWVNAQAVEARSLKQVLMAPVAWTYLFVRHGFCLSTEERANMYFDWTCWWSPENAG